MSRLDRYRPKGDPLMTRAQLWACDRLRWLYVLAGVEYEQFRTLLRAKLLVDGRRRRKHGSWSIVAQAGFALVLCMDGLAGVLIGLTALIVVDPLWFVTIASGGTMLMLAFHMVLDFSHLLVDTTDIEILEPLPLNQRSILAVRMTHVSLYVVAIVGAMSIGPLIFGPITFGIWPYLPLYVLTAAASGLLVLVGLALAYLMVLRFAPAARVKDALVYLQIVLVIVVLGGMHVGPRLLEFFDVRAILSTHRHLLLAFPPCWFGGLHDVALGGARDPLSLALASCAVVAPLLLLLLLRLVTGGQGILERLIMLNRGGGGESAPPRATHGIAGRLAPRLTSGATELAGFTFALANASRDRGFKMRSWPGLALAVLPLGGLLFLDEERSGQWQSYLPYLIYISAFVSLAMAVQSRFTDQPDASWLLADLDDAQRAAFTRGGLIGMLTRYVGVPLALYIPIALALGGHPPDVLFALLASIAIGGGLAVAGLDTLPFSRRFHQSEAGNTALAMAGMFGLFAVIGVHAALAHWSTYAVLACCLPLSWLAWITLRRIRCGALRVRRVAI